MNSSQETMYYPPTIYPQVFYNYNQKQLIEKNYTSEKFQISINSTKKPKYF